MEIIYSAAGSRGLLRKENQDRIYITGQSIRKDNAAFCYQGSLSTDEHPLAAVFDGMGGESCGAMAATLAAETAEQLCRTNPDIELCELCRQMNGRICEYMHKNGVRSMGTTAAIIRFLPDSAQLCNIGDSRIYRLVDGKLEQLSVDHVMTMGFFKRRVLTQHLGIPLEEMKIEPHISSVQLRAGDVFLLCSDGLTDMVDNSRISEVMRFVTTETPSNLLVSEALLKGGRDNVSVIVCWIR